MRLSNMTTRVGSYMQPTVRARDESQGSVSFVLHAQTSITLPTSLSFMLHPPPTSILTATPSNPANSTISQEPTSAPISLSSNTSIISTQPTAPPEEKPKPKETWSLNIESGNKGVHIGSWTLDETYYGIRRGLRERCGNSRPAGKQRRKDAKPAPFIKKWGMNTCSSEDSLYDREYSTLPGVHSLSIKCVKVRISSSYIPEEYGVNLQNIFIEQVADIFRIAVKDDKNCHHFDTKATSCTFCIDTLCTWKIPGKDKGKKLNKTTRVRRWCNVPDYVRVALADSEGKEQAHMKVEVSIICPEEEDLDSTGCIMEMGRFDCMAVIGVVSGEARVNGTRSAMLKKTTQGKNVDVVAACPNKQVTGTCPNEECTYRLGGCFGWVFGNS